MLPLCVLAVLCHPFVHQFETSQECMDTCIVSASFSVFKCGSKNVPYRWHQPSPVKLQLPECIGTFTTKSCRARKLPAHASKWNSHLLDKGKDASPQLLPCTFGMQGLHPSAESSPVHHLRRLCLQLRSAQVGSTRRDVRNFIVFVLFHGRGACALHVRDQQPDARRTRTACSRASSAARAAFCK